MAKKKKTSSDDLAATIADKLRVGEGFQLADRNPGSKPGFKGKAKAAQKAMDASQAELDDLQERLYANGRDGDGPAVLLVVQGMDTAGKGGIIRHVVGSVDPQGVHLHAFKVPTAEERKHPFLWRVRQQMPAPGMLGVFDRSHYEDVLVVRVHDMVPASDLSRRYGQINQFERSYTDRGVHIVKIMLHLSATEQRARLMGRLQRPDKWWKYNPADVTEREQWDAYAEAYQIMLDKTSTEIAPWYVVPADKKWYAHLAVQQILLHTLRGLQLDWPEATFDVTEEKKRVAGS